MLNGTNTTDHQRWRLTVLMAVVGVAFAVIVTELYLLQIVHYQEYKLRSEQNAMRTVPIDAPRGRILDRYGNIIVGNRAAYTVGVIPAEVQNVEALDSLVSVAAGVPRQTLAEKVRGTQRWLHRPIYVRRDTPFATVAYLEEHRDELPGVIYLIESRRRYPYGTLGAHMLGYTREIRESKLEELKSKGYVAGDLIGQAGVEARYEEHLRGEKGEEYEEVTVSGRVVDRQRREPVRGSDIRLGVDLYLQRIAEAAMDTLDRGALVAMDPRNGEILAMVSRPVFDPAAFSYVVSRELWQQLNDNAERPMFNRAIQAGYPPGSTAKMIAAMAGLQTGVIDTNTRLQPCTGAFWYGRRRYLCWKKGGHGALNVTHAIEQSCNVFFYQVGLRLGLDRWSPMAYEFGLGGLTGVDIPAEEKGLVASTEVYNRKLGPKRWGQGEALNAAIGQGITLVTPVQAVRYVAALGTGYLVTPHLAIGVIGPDGVERKLSVPPPKQVPVDSSALAVVRRAMVLVTGPGGTARKARVPGYRVAGKTGTAQNPHGKDHAWFIAFAPAEAPVIAVAVVAENAGHGSEIAAPIAGRVLRARLLHNQAVPEMPGNSAAPQMADVEMMGGQARWR